MLRSRRHQPAGVFPLRPVEDLLHYNEHFHLAQQGFAVALHRLNGIHLCSTKLPQILLSLQFFHMILLPLPDKKHICRLCSM